MLADDRILAPGITIVEEEGTLTAADLGGNSVPNESKLLFHLSNSFCFILFIFLIRCCHV